MTARPAPTSTVLFVDLDGTLTLDNSFHVFLAQSWRLGGNRTRGRLVAALVQRLLLGGSDGRITMKRRVLNAVSRVDEVRRARIVDSTIAAIQPALSSPVLDLVRSWEAQGAPVVLATAAPALYARPLAEMLGFTDCLATSMPQGRDWVELLGEAKAAACLDWAQAHGVAASEGGVRVVTDHVDDLPLARIAGHVTFQGSAASFATMAQALGGSVPVEHLDTTAGERGGGLWLWFDDRPSGPHDQWEVRTIASKHRYALIYTGDGRWTRLRHGTRLGGLSQRRTCPALPSPRDRMRIMSRRRIVRDRLGIFH